MNEVRWSKLAAARLRSSWASGPICGKVHYQSWWWYFNASLVSLHQVSRWGTRRITSWCQSCCSLMIMRRTGIHWCPMLQSSSVLVPIAFKVLSLYSQGMSISSFRSQSGQSKIHLHWEPLSNLSQGLEMSWRIAIWIWGLCHHSLYEKLVLRACTSCRDGGASATAAWSP